MLAFDSLIVNPVEHGRKQVGIVVSVLMRFKVAVNPTNDSLVVDDVGNCSVWFMELFKLRLEHDGFHCE